jgi:hypothetical protein
VARSQQRDTYNIAHLRNEAALAVKGRKIDICTTSSVARSQQRDTYNIAHLRNEAALAVKGRKIDICTTSSDNKF